MLINDNLCIFSCNEKGIIMLLPPLGNSSWVETLDICFDYMSDYMDHIGQDTPESNIEIVDQAFVPRIPIDRFQVNLDALEYIYHRDSLVQMRGRAYKSKRHSINYLLRNHEVEYKDFSNEYRQDCLRVSQKWCQQKQNRRLLHKHPLYDSFLNLSLEMDLKVMNLYNSLGLKGGIVLVDGEVAAFTFGVQISSDTACILTLRTDLEVNGLAPFIDKTFAEQFVGCTWINAMDDCGFSDVRRAKFSYHPAFVLPIFRMWPVDLKVNS
ncbi:MAG: phosphatidylglycerol lysyltransferase domain-containing protein [Candidatus Poribacteria bacterium]|nr:phosphatidylglycerol lysyltransferase domain-containing protein [Candidatus Poribacteria bacterium]